MGGLALQYFSSLCAQALGAAVTTLVPWIARSWRLLKKQGMWYKQEDLKTICTKGKWKVSRKPKFS